VRVLVSTFGNKRNDVVVVQCQTPISGAGRMPILIVSERHEFDSMHTINVI
jgi:hypothetical protein